jgi:5-methylcytosine-specific restriction endonuclease McrA
VARCPRDAIQGGRGRCSVHKRTDAQRGYDYRWKQLRRKVRASACARCGTSVDLTVDHIVPRSMGGSDSPVDLRTLCRRCHGRIGMQSNRRGMRR